MRISMPVRLSGGDGRGRAYDNIFIERLWRTVKYEKIYLNDYQDGIEAYFALDQYFRFYNEEQLHSLLDYKTPREVYYSQVNSDKDVSLNLILTNI